MSWLSCIFTSTAQGHAPLNWAIINGLKKTGVSLFRITDKIDSGEVFIKKNLKLIKVIIFLT